MEELVFRAILFGAGLAALAVAVIALARKKMTELLCMVWGALALLLIAGGLLLRPADWKRYLSHRGLILLVLTGIALFATAYLISVVVSELLCQNREAAIQIALLRHQADEEAAGQRRKELLLILPAYNEGENLPGLLKQLKEAGVGETADLLVIDDGSADRTYEQAKLLGCGCIRAIFHLGYGSALQMGYQYAARKGYRYVIQMDSDGQHDPCNVEALYRALREPDADGRLPDIVLGSRFLPGGQSFPIPWVKLLAIRLFRLALQGMVGQRITDPTTGLQGLSARTIAFYAGYGNFDSQYPDANMLLQMLLRGFRVREIPAVMHGRRLGKSMHSGLRPLAYLFHMAFSMPAVYIRETLLRRGQDGGAQDL